uniref:Centrosomal protein of 97 kDa (inferred by orthology to a human protein) n=1 Tax=Strongyloides venezuelensis TaxID=75913 RepID=A0A0K0EUK3_STRVS
MPTENNSTKARLNLMDQTCPTPTSPSHNQMNMEEPTIDGGSLNLSGLGISRINLKFKDKYKNLRKLDISNNAFHAASGFKYFFDLEELNASNNCIQHLYFVQPLARSIKILDLSHNELKQVESEIFCKLYFLEECDLSYNQIAKIRLSHDLPRLRHLSFSNNFITSIPLINNFSSLTTLNLANNQLSCLLDISKSLPKTLKHLDISGNVINDITEFMYIRGMELLSLKIENNPCVKTSGRSFCYRAYFAALVRSLTELDGFLIDDVDKLKGEFLTMNGIFIKFKPKVTSHTALCEFLTEQCPLSEVPNSSGRMSLKSVTGEKFSKIYDSFRSNSSVSSFNDENVSPRNSRIPQTKINFRNMPKSHSNNSVVNGVVDASFKLNNLRLDNVEPLNELDLTHELLESEDDCVDSGTRSVSQASNLDSSRTVQEISSNVERPVLSTNQNQISSTNGLNGSEKIGSLQYHSLESLSEESVEDSKKLYKQASAREVFKDKYHIIADIDKINIRSSKVDIVVVSDKQKEPPIEVENNVMEVTPREEVATKSSSKKCVIKKILINRKRKTYNKERYLILMRSIKVSRMEFEKQIKSYNDAIKSLKEENEKIRLDLQGNLEEYKEVINSHAISISCLQDKIHEQQKSIDDLKSIVSKVYPVVRITDVTKAKNDVIEIQWTNEQCILNSIKGYDVHVDNKYAGLFKGANKFISIAKLDLNTDHEVKIKCVVEGMEDIADLPSTTFKLKKKQSSNQSNDD